MDGMNSSATNALSAMGMDLDEVLEVDKAWTRQANERDGRICLCGHGVSRHTMMDGGLVYCKPSKMGCPCRRIRPVLDADDIRPFMRKTQGSGANHALSRGLAGLAAKGGDAHWLVELVCDNPACGSPDGVAPAAVTSRGRMTDDATGYDVLLCAECRALGGADIDG